MSESFIPEFSGNPEDLKSFCDMILHDMTIEQLAGYAISSRMDAQVTPSGYELPKGLATSALDCVAGVDTDLPMPVSMGQTWNKELVKEVGAVIGDERRGRLSASDPNTMSYAGLADIRCNPLSGRIYEGFGEDPYQVAVMTDLTGRGAIGDDDFYTKVQIGTKHFMVYHSEWDRAKKTLFINNRSLHDYQLQCYAKAIKNNSHTGIMTAYGAINGIPNAIDPYIRDIQKLTDYRLLLLTDVAADHQMIEGLGNGYDQTYAQNLVQIAALMILNKNIPTSGDATVDNYIDAFNNGTLGVTRNDLEEFIRPQIELWVRSGYFNQSSYPYTSISAEGAPVTSASETSQKTALQAAEESIVLLKNDHNVLPLKKDTSILLTGMFADYRTTTWYGIATPEGIEHTKLTPRAAIEAYSEGAVEYVPELAGTNLRLKSVSADKYLKIENEKLVASGDSTGEASIFQMYDWGQDAYSFLNLNTDSIITGTDNTDDISMTPRDPFSSYPVLTFEDAGNNQKLMRYGTILNRFYPNRIMSTIPYYQWFSKLGRYLALDDSGVVLQGAEVAEGYTDNNLFDVEIVDRAGEKASAYVDANDYAVVIIGADTFVGASELSDRANLKIGADQLLLVNNVANQFPEKTIVVIRSDLPLDVEELKNNDKVASILYTSYAGEFDSYALAKVIYGDAVPSGRLTNSWIRDNSSLPPYTGSEEVDERYSVDMIHGDPLDTKLTYLYNNPDDVIYEFGYGLSYTQFRYTDMQIILAESGDIEAKVTVKNVGDIAGKEVIQLYATEKESAYAPYVANKKLVAFEKTRLLQPGESEEVNLTVDIEYLQKWDVVSKQYLLEQGDYVFKLSTSSEKSIYEETLSLVGEVIGEISLNEEVNIWENSYAQKGIQGIEVSKARTIKYEGGYFAANSFEKDGYVILPHVNLTGVSKLSFRVAYPNEGSSAIEVRAGRIDGDVICSFSFSKTDTIEYNLNDDDTIPVTELSYEIVTCEVEREFFVSDMVIIFKNEETRMDYITAI